MPRENARPGDIAPSMPRIGPMGGERLVVAAAFAYHGGIYAGRRPPLLI